MIKIVERVGLIPNKTKQTNKINKNKINRKKYTAPFMMHLVFFLVAKQQGDLRMKTGYNHCKIKLNKIKYFDNCKYKQRHFFMTTILQLVQKKTITESKDKDL